MNKGKNLLQVKLNSELGVLLSFDIANSLDTRISY